MRSSLVLLALSAAISSTSASILPARSAPALPASAFTQFHALSLSDAQSGADLPPGGFNTTTPTFGASAGGAQTAASAACSANPNIRIEWRSYSASDRAAYVGAVKCLMNKGPSGAFPPARSRYEDFVRLHQMWMPNIHGNPKFLIWHRYFLWTFHMVLRDECGFDRQFPWWDETLDAGNFEGSSLFTDSYFGRLPGPDGNGNPVCIESGAFAGLTCNIGPGTSTTTPHCLSRSVSESLTAQCNSGFVNTCNSRGDYASMESCSEGGPHAYGHNGIGAVMSDVSASPSDPIFYMHHAFIDHNFRIWQNGNNAVRTTTINGNDHFGVPLTMDTTVSVAGIRPDVKIGDIMNTMSGVQIGAHTFCYKYSY